LADLNTAYKLIPNKMDDPNLAVTTPTEGTLLPLEEVWRPKAVTTVQLCPWKLNYAGAYPLSGIVIRHKIYAQLDPNQEGLYTRLAPGRYSANAVGSACSFTVTTSGTVEH